MFAAMQKPSSLRQLKRLRCRMVALLQFLILLQLAPPFANGDTKYEYYDPWELDALQALRLVWNDTPAKEVNFHGWSSVVQTPCNNFFTQDAKESNWQGVQCALFYSFDLSSSDPYLRIVDLNIRDSNIVGILPLDIFKLTSLSTLEISGNRNLTGELPDPNDSLYSTYLSILDLHSNGFHGSVATSLFSLYNFLNYLSDNNFTEPFPHGATTYMKRLELLNLAENKFDGQVPYEAVEGKEVLQRLLQGNPFCNTTNGNDGTRCFCNQICLNTEVLVEVHRANTGVVIIATTSASSGLVFTLFIAVAILHHRSKRYKQYLLARFEEKFQQFDIKPTIFSYNDIRLATKDFHADLRLGAGAYGAVYKGEFLNKNDKNVFAVKRLLILPSQGIDSFLNEVVLITGMRHRNLVALKGCCLRDKERLLVYEYIDNGDVEQLFFGEKRAFVDWQTRIKICIGMANGLHYLHDLANPRIIHRDIKAANILLDANFEAKIADFGLALLFPDGTNHIETVTIAGTRGYLAPAYASRGQLSNKADVYSFGILCLEIVSGRRNSVPTSSPDQIYILEWARQLQRDGNAMAVLDRTVDQLSDVEQDEVRRVIHVALQCTHSEAAPRPTMANVVAMLLGQSVSETMTLAMSPAMSVFNTSILEEDSESSEFSQTQSEFVALNSTTKVSSSSYSLRIRNSIPGTPTPEQFQLFVPNK